MATIGINRQLHLMSFVVAPISVKPVNQQDTVGMENE